MSGPDGPPRVLVVGGGIAGLAAAWRLSEPGWRQRWGSITVLERTGRLGGKGASGRGPHGRIEEHGLHVWLGCYDNAFRLVREVYGELDRERTDPACPIRTWRDAFFPAPQLGLFEARAGGGWDTWVATFTGNRLLPGDAGADGRFPTVAELLLRGALLLRDFRASLAASTATAPAVTLSASRTPPRPATGPTLVPLLTTLAHHLVLLAARGSRLAGPRGADAVAAAFAPALRELGRRVATDPAARRMHALLDTMGAMLTGMLRDGLGGDRAAYDAINDLDVREWLRRNGARPATLDATLTRGGYDLAMSHEGGTGPGSVAAGWGVFLSFKMWLDYKGAIFWKMRAGMGETVFAPLYQALAARGVEFRFGCDVTELVPSPDRTTIDAVEVREPPGEWPPAGPLARVGNLPAWPGAGAPPADSVPRLLRRGADFEALVLAVPPAAARGPARRLAAQRPAWRAMLDGVPSVPTQAFQLWLKPDERSLGWPRPGTTMSAFAKPFDTWASMSHLLPFEGHAAEGGPRTVAYFCGTMTDAGRDAAAARGATRADAIAHLERYAHVFWPHAVDAAGRFRWDLLAADDDATGPERFDTQYWTANVAPSDRYVQSLPGTHAVRLRPDGSGYRNLVLAGDWTDCGWNVGCIEAAAVSGLQAANALEGRPRWDRICGVLLR